MLNQTYKNLEIIIIDDGSSDGSATICDNLKLIDDRIVVEHIIHEGVSAARNRGLEISSGDYIMFIDSDDYIDRDLIMYGFNLIKKYNADIVKFEMIKQTRFLKKAVRIPLKKDKIISIDDEFISNNIFVNDIFCTSCGNIYKADIAKRVLFDKKYRVGEDFLYFSTILRITKSIVISGKNYYHYIVNNNSTTHSYNLDENIEKSAEAITVNREIEKLLFSKQIKQKKMPRLIKSKRNILAFVNLCIENNNYKSFIRCMEQYKNNITIAEELDALKDSFNKSELQLIQDYNKLQFIKNKIIQKAKKTIRKIF